MKPLDEYANTDLGNAERFIAMHSGNLRYVPQWKQWLVWDGKRWSPDEGGAVMRLAIATAKAMASAADGGTDFAKWAIKSQDAAKLSAMIKLAATSAHVEIDCETLDSDPFLLNCENGTIDLRSGALREHRREDLITKLTAVSFDSTATCPTWDRFLATVLGGDEELGAFLRRACGYALTGDVREHVLFVLHGSGANGKSTFLNAIQDALGPYAAPAVEDLLLEKDTTSHATELADLKGVRLAICIETPRGKWFAENRLKQLTGGDRIKARRLYEDFWSFLPTHKFFVGTNHRPAVSEGSEAIMRRLRFVPFEVTIPETDRDPQLGAKLRDELPGILAWCVRGCSEWQRDGLGMPSKVKEATEAYRKEQDPVSAFLAECCERDASGKVEPGDLLAAYRHWANDNDAIVVSTPDFQDRLTSLGFTPRKTNGRRYRTGLRLMKPAPVRLVAPNAN